MAKQIMEVITWTQAEGFAEAYRTASANARGLFQAAVIKLAARADQLREVVSRSDRSSPAVESEQVAEDACRPGRALRG